MTERGWIDLEGAFNVRDVGGLPAGARRTRPGVLLRADAVDGVTEADVRFLAQEIGLAQVIDLRTRAERLERSEGGLVAAGIEVVELEAFDTKSLVRRRRVRSELYASGVDPITIMVDGYVEMLELGGPAFAAALARLVAPDGTPALVHCTAGKDRTGVLVALLLEAAGVDRDAVIADYAATSERMAPVIARIRGAEAFQHLADDMPAFVLEAHPETMTRFLAELDARHGSASAFLQLHGASEAQLSTWRDLLVS